MGILFRYGYLLMMGLTMAFHVSCIDEFRLDNVEEEDFLVVDGLITNEAGPYVVKLSRTVPSNVAEISNADIRIIDDTGRELRFFERSPGFYESDSTSSFQGMLGFNYTLHINTDGGNKYESSPEVILAVPRIEGMSYEVRSEVAVTDAGNEVDRSRLRVFLNTQSNQGTSTYLRWDYRGAFIVKRPNPCVPCPQFCWVPDDDLLTTINVFGSEQRQVAPINNVPLSFLQPDFKLDSLYVFWVKQYSLGANAFNFWRSVDNQSSNSGTIFDPPPGEIVGNIFDVNNPENRVLGYFGASAVANQMLEIQNIDIPPGFLDPVLFPECNETFTADYCEDCTQFPNSRLNFPTDLWP